jgi:CBS domain-containing protein
LKVSEIMSRNVQRCTPTDSMYRAAQLMYERNCGCVAIVGRDGHIYGIVTDRDVCLAAYLRDEPLRHIKIQEEMSTNLRTCTPDTDVEEAERLMRTSKVRRLPVVDEHATLVGVVSLGDIALAALRSPDAISERSVFKTLAAVSMHDPAPADASFS